MSTFKIISTTKKGSVGLDKKYNQDIGSKLSLDQVGHQERERSMDVRVFKISFDFDN